MKINKNEFNNYVRKNVFNTISDYNLIEDNDHVMIGVSGGKDSILTLHMLNQYKQEGNIKFSLEAVCIDEGIAGYRKDGIKTAIENCKKLDIDLTITSFKDQWGHDLDDICSIYSSTCMPCGIYRRYLLNKVSDDHCCDKIATGHNLDDEIQSFLMTFSRNDQNKFSKFGPKLDRIHENMTPRIKPLWQLPEKDVGLWCVLNEIPIHSQECPYSSTSLRSSVKAFLNDLEEEKRNVKLNIFNSFKKTLKLPKQDVKLIKCQKCNQATAKSPCKACSITEEIDSILKEG